MLIRSNTDRTTTATITTISGTAATGLVTLKLLYLFIYLFIENQSPVFTHVLAF